MGSQIVERIKAVPNETKLLVLDPEADAYYQERGIQVSGFQSNVVYLKSPLPSSNNHRRDESTSGDEDDRVKMRHQVTSLPQFVSFLGKMIRRCAHEEEKKG